jgi:hypothetical protein
MVRATLLAPFDGLVTGACANPETPSTVGSTVLRIVDTHRVYVNAALDETVLSAAGGGSAGRHHLPGFGAARARRVTRVAWEADRQTHELLVEVTPEPSWSAASPSASAPTCASKSRASRTPCGCPSG